LLRAIALRAIARVRDNVSEASRAHIQGEGVRFDDGWIRPDRLG
jgi:hypothetical protein